MPMAGTRFKAALTMCLVMLIVTVTPVRAQDVPTLTGRVVDNAEILSPETELAVTWLLKAHEDSTGNQIAVLTIPSLNGEAVEEYSLRVARSWALGTRDDNNGVLLLVAVDDREMRIEVGLGLEGTLTDLRASRILRGDIRKHFRDGNYDAGVSAAVFEIIGVLDGTYEPPDNESLAYDDAPMFLGFLFMVLPLFFMVLGILSRGFHYWFMLIFLSPFFFVSGTIIMRSHVGGLAIVLMYALVYLVVGHLPKIKKLQKGEEVKIGRWTTSGLSPSSGSGWSSGGGGGFSGGGGSFGGGGSSGSW